MEQFNRWFELVLLIYGIACILIAIMQPRPIFRTKKFEIMMRIFGGKTGLLIFIVVWGIAAIALGYWL